MVEHPTHGANNASFVADRMCRYFVAFWRISQIRWTMFREPTTDFLVHLHGPVHLVYHPFPPCIQDPLCQKTCKLFVFVVSTSSMKSTTVPYVAGSVVIHLSKGGTIELFY